MGENIWKWYDQQGINFQNVSIQATYMVQIRKGTKTRDQIVNICWIVEKAREFQKKKKKSTSASLTMLKPLCGSQQTGKLERWGYQTTLPVSWETCMQVKKQKNQTWNNGLVQNLERRTSKLYIVTLLI